MGGSVGCEAAVSETALRSNIQQQYRKVDVEGDLNIDAELLGDIGGGLTPSWGRGGDISCGELK